MPVYEYQCNACGREFEYQQRMVDPDLTDCEACGKPALEKLISRTAFSLKGGGWYKDLYASAKPEGTKKDAAASTSGGEAAAKPAPASDGGTSGTGSSGGTSGTSGTSGGSSGGTAGGGSSTSAAAGKAT